MRTYTFTIFTDDGFVYGYLFDVTGLEAQKTVDEINAETGTHHYYMQGFFNDK